jgi:hypothetical protein
MKDDRPHDRSGKKGIGTAFRYILSFAGWLYLARVSLLGLVLLIGLPLGAHGAFRALAIGVFDLHLLTGSFMVGFMLPFAAWATFVTAAMVFLYGARRSRFDVELPPEWILPAWRFALALALLANLWTIFAATDAGERMRIIPRVAGGMVVGMMLIALIEELHRRTSHHWVGGSLYLFPIKSQRVSMKDVAREQDVRRFKAATQPQDWLMRGYREGDGQGGWEWMPGHRLLFWGSVVFFAVNIAIYYFSYENQTEMTALIYLLVLFTMAILIGGGVSFFLDAYRLPFVSACIVWLWLVGRTDHSDHYYRIWAQPSRVAENAVTNETGPLTPAQLMARAVQARRPIVLVAIAGGGIQSSAWGTRVLTGLEEAFQEARKSGRLDADFPDFAGSVQCISGVSGGATGAMFFVAAYGADGLPSPRPTVPPDQSPTPLIDEKLLTGIVRAAEETSLGQAVWGLAYPDLRRAWFPFFTGDDYMDRAERMERKWAQNAVKNIGSLGEKLSDVSLVDWQRDVREGLRPAIIFNGTMVETGERICFSTAPPRAPIGGQREFVTSGPVTSQTQGTQLYPGADLRIVTAARLSATFPIISPAARPLFAESGEAHKGMERPEAGESGRRHVVDGGYYEIRGSAHWRSGWIAA